MRGWLKSSQAPRAVNFKTDDIDHIFIQEPRNLLKRTCEVSYKDWKGRLLKYFRRKRTRCL